MKEYKKLWSGCQEKKPLENRRGGGTMLPPKIYNKNKKEAVSDWCSGMTEQDWEDILTKFFHCSSFSGIEYISRRELGTLEIERTENIHGISVHVAKGGKRYVVHPVFSFSTKNL